MRVPATICAACAVLAGQAAIAQEAIAPEKLTVEERIAPGANVLTLDQSWSGQSRINVLSTSDLKMKGNMGVGLIGQMVLAPGGETLYTASVYAPRITYGPQEAVIHEFDIATLTHKREFTVSNKMAMAEPQPALLQLAGDAKFLLVQNATPATSVSVADLAKGEQIAEVPTPGCWGALPVAQDLKFLSLCGDGTMQVFSFDAAGKIGEPVKSEKIFDADKDALFTNPAKMGDDWLFASFNGNLYHVAVKDGKAVLVDKFATTEGVEGDWAPGGSEVIAYNAPTGTAYVLMHSGAEDGSHKDGAEEIWAVDVKAKKVLYRSNAHAENTITVTQGAAPVIFAVSEENALYRYEVDPEAKFAAKLAGEAEDMGNFVGLVLATE